MLSVGLAVDITVADAVEEQIFGNILDGERAVLYDDQRLCGVCRYALKDEQIFINRIGVREEDREYLEFFTRVILYKFSLYGFKIIIPSYDKSFEKFGFIEEGGMMSAYGDEIVFPSECKGGKI